MKKIPEATEFLSTKAEFLELLSAKADMGPSLFYWFNCGVAFGCLCLELFSFPASLSHDNSEESACEFCEAT